MKKVMGFLIVTSLLSACAVSEKQIKEALRKDPKIVFDTIEEHPEQFIEVVNRAAQKAQESQYQKRLAAQAEEQERDIKNPKTPQISADRRLTGSDAGKIVIVEYADFQCPACRVAYTSLQQFKEKYKDQVQFYYKHMPLDFHPMAYPSALYFEALRLQDKNKAVQFYEELFSNQKDLSESFLRKAAQKVGANMQKLAVDLKSEKVKKIIAADMEEFQRFGFNGTPTILINGVAMNGAQSLQAMEKLAERIKKAD